MPHDPSVAVGSDDPVHARRWRTLGVLCLSLTIVMIANMSLNLALPAIARDLDASTGALQWMVDAYALVFAGLLFTAGTLGDRYGRKGALQIGLALFLVGSVAAMTASSSGPLIAARALMGVAAAFIMPSTLSILTNVFPADERGRAIATWAGVSGGAAALGPVASGLLLEHLWWGSVFLVNVPLAGAALLLGRRLVPASRDPRPAPLDVPGALLSVVGVGALVYAIIEAPHRGWAAPDTAVALAVAVTGLGAFAWRETTARHPMLDLRLFADRRFGVASAGIGLTYFTLFGTFFLVSQLVQLVLGLSPLRAGIVQLPVSLIMLLATPRVPRLVERVGVRAVVTGGLGLVGVGMLVLSRTGTGSSVWLVVGALVPMAFGIAGTGAPLTTLMMSAVPARRAGVGSAMNNASREVGGALGVAVLGSIVTTQFTSSLGPALASVPAEAHARVETGLAGALGVAAELPAGAGGTLADAARGAFVDGFGAAGLTAAALAAALAAGAWLLLPRGVGSASTEPFPAPDRPTPDDGFVPAVVPGGGD